MKRKVFFIIVVNGLFILFGCNGNSDKTENNQLTKNEVNKDNVTVPTTSCYVLENGKDTVSLKMTIDDNQVTGDLVYHYFEKDRNTGTIKGEMIGDTLLATYTFISEGKESKRDVLFLKKGDSLIEGYGNVNAFSGKPDFSDRSAIKFDDKFVLKKSDCE